MKYLNILVGCLLAFSVVSCDDFLDVRPKAEKLENDLFKNAQGFEDAIYGVYGSLQNSALYGRHLTWGIPEVLAQNLYSTNSAIEDLSEYNYEDNDNLRTMFSDIWTTAYQTIGYTNNILEQLNDWSQETLPLYNYYKGEMLAIRAMLHFDLVRLFAPMDMNKEGIPYVKAYSYDVKPFFKVGEVYNLILSDLLEAEKLMKEEENMLTYPHDNTNYFKFMNYRETHLNLYAVRALLARVYWMKNDMAQAANYATLVIEGKAFPLVDDVEIKDYMAGTLSPKETIFGVYSTSYLDLCESYFYDFVSYHSYVAYDDASGTTYMEPYKAVYAKDVPPTSQDFRLLGHFREFAGLARFLKTTDYYSLEGSVPDNRRNLISGITLLHTSEMYLIAAEALLDTDYDAAVAYFDEELKSRGITPLSQRDGETLTKEMIFNEYRKEMFGEGQTWYNMKRLNRDIISNAELRTIPASETVYVIPIPEEEYEYRND